MLLLLLQSALTAEVYPQGVPAASAVGSPAVAWRAQASPAGLSSSAAFGAPAILRTSVAALQVGSLGSTALVGGPSIVRLQLAQVQAPAISAVSACGAPLVVGLQGVPVAPAAVLSASAFGVPSLRVRLLARAQAGAGFVPGAVVSVRPQQAVTVRTTPAMGARSQQAAPRRRAR